ncbi:MAG: prolipoprotein diacylglyceryl transferase [Clostridia bacterium]|nr:prolipoprotein diacylglyceryl transferase [Clostridia bacterium]
MIVLQWGSVAVYRYGLAMACAALIALLFMEYLGKRQGLRYGTVSHFALWAIPLGVLGGRLGYCLVSFNWLMEQGLSFFFQFARGGYMLYGAMAGVILAGFLTGKCTRQNAGRILDVAAAPAALLIALGRIAEPLVGLGYGHNIEEWFDPFAEKSMVAWEDPSLLYRFPLGAQDYYGDWNFAIFLPEALTALAILMILLAMKPRREGGKALLTVLLYAACQTIWESMRQDAVLRWGFVRCSQLISALAIAAVLVICWRNLPPNEKTLGRLAAGFGWILLCCGVIMAMEFALEQKIDFLTWMRMDVCYLVMALGSLGLIFSVLPVWKKAYERK